MRGKLKVIACAQQKVQAQTDLKKTQVYTID